MSKRITLTDFEIEQITEALKELSKQPSLRYEVTKAGQRLYDQLIAKLKTEPLSQKVSPSSAESSVAHRSGHE